MSALHSIEIESPAVGALKPSRLQAYFAHNLRDIRASQRLRYEVFAHELGANLSSASLGIDCDALDPFCEHLLVRDNQRQQIIGSTRLLTDKKAQLAGGFYSATEFDLTAFNQIQGRILEVGRTCIHADYRNGSTIATLWSELAAYIQRNEFDYLIGCASIHLDEGEKSIQHMLHYLQNHHLSSDAFRVKARVPYPLKTTVFSGKPCLPPLLKAYMNLGAQICGDACLDVDFAVVDVFICLDLKRLSSRYARHFLQRSA